MISALQTAKEDTVRHLVGDELFEASHENENQDFSFLDKLYNTNALYRHLFPENQSLGTIEKEPLLENDALSKALPSDDDSHS